MSSGSSAPTPDEARDSACVSLEQQLLSGTYRVAPENFWSHARMRGDDGYDIMEPARTNGWHPIPSWGRDGSDLGSWPYVAVYHRHVKDTWDVACYVEGDLTVYSYPTRDLRDAATDCLAFWHWTNASEDWVAGFDTVDVAPDHLRGPFSWARLEAKAG